MVRGEPHVKKATGETDTGVLITWNTEKPGCTGSNIALNMPDGEAGVDTALVSASGLIEELDREDSVRFARATNDAVAEACKRYPGRIMGTICLPTPYVEESLEELDRAVNELGLKYWHTHCNYGDEDICEGLLATASDFCGASGQFDDMTALVLCSKGDSDLGGATSFEESPRLTVACDFASLHAAIDQLLATSVFVDVVRTAHRTMSV